MLTIKLSRFGKKKQPTYRIIVLEKTKDPWGDYLEMLGHYNPRTKAVELKTDRIKYWLSKGAQASDTVHNILVSQGVIENKKKTVTRISAKRTKKINEKNKKTAVPQEAPKEEKPASESAPQEAPKEEKPASESAPQEAPKEEKPAETPADTPLPEQTEEDKQ